MHYSLDHCLDGWMVVCMYMYACIYECMFGCMYRNNKNLSCSLLLQFFMPAINTNNANLSSRHSMIGLL